MNNVCQFSPDRRYRYVLEHVFDPALPLRRVMWIGLNPSTADENKLDPTLRRIRAFSAAWGYTSFVMTNLFAFRATLPNDMKRAADPVGPENDWTLSSWCRQCDAVVAAWGNDGHYLDRQARVLAILRGAGVTPMSLVPPAGAQLTSVGCPRHPLYVHGSSTLAAFSGVVVATTLTT